MLEKSTEPMGFVVGVEFYGRHTFLRQSVRALTATLQRRPAAQLVGLLGSGPGIAFACFALFVSA